MYPLKLPHSVKKSGERLAKEDGVSLHQWIAAALDQEAGVLETAAAFFQTLASKPRASVAPNGWTRRISGDLG